MSCIVESKCEISKAHINEYCVQTPHVWCSKEPSTTNMMACLHLWSLSPFKTFTQCKGVVHGGLLREPTFEKKNVLTINFKLQVHLIDTIFTPKTFSEKLQTSLTQSK